MKAKLLQTYRHPYGILTGSRGGMHVQPNENVVIGWGRWPDITEHDKEGNLLYFARFFTNVYSINKKPNLKGWEFSYRAYKFPWVGHPLQKPKAILERSPDKPSGVSLWVSWNGATEVDAWRISAAAARKGSRSPAGTFEKQGFETEIHINQTTRGESHLAFPVIVIEAIDKTGAVLATTSVDSFSKIRLILLLFLIFAIEVSAYVLEFLWPGAAYRDGHNLVNIVHYEKDEHSGLYEPL